jgi:hypothetical protein
MGIPAKYRWQRGLVNLATMIVFCLFIDFFPTYGKPGFSYEGIVPNQSVWNFGFPKVFFIYDPAHNPPLFAGPDAAVAISMETLLIAAYLAMVIADMVKNRRRPC